jgi:cell division transport system permease protein
LSAAASKGAFVGLSSLAFLIDDAGKSIRRNGLMSIAALTTVTIAMAVFGGAVFALYRLHQFADAQPRQFEIAVFLRPDLPREKAMAAQSRIDALPNVARVGLFTREQAMTQLQEDDRSAGSSIAEALAGDNPLPDRLDVRVSDPAMTGRVSAALRDRRAFPEVDRVRDERDTLNKLIATSTLVRNVGCAVAALLFIATTFVIQNTIRLTVVARRREIRIMQLVGATPSFIRFPMVLEGLFYGAAGALVASAIVLFVAYQTSRYVGKFDTPLSQAMPPALGAHVVVASLVACGILIGWTSSMVSIRRFLKRI